MWTKFQNQRESCALKNVTKLDSEECFSDFSILISEFFGRQIEPPPFYAIRSLHNDFSGSFFRLFSPLKRTFMGPRCIWKVFFVDIQWDITWQLIEICSLCFKMLWSDVYSSNCPYTVVQCRISNPEKGFLNNGATGPLWPFGNALSFFKALIDDELLLGGKPDSNVSIQTFRNLPFSFNEPYLRLNGRPILIWIVCWLFEAKRWKKDREDIFLKSNRSWNIWNWIFVVTSYFFNN